MIKTVISLHDFDGKFFYSIEDLFANMDFDDEDDDNEEKVSKKKKSNASWLAEGHDEPINLLDQSVSRKIVGKVM